MWWLFRFLYHALYALLGFVLFILTLLTPADIIYQSYQNNRPGNIYATVGVCVITILLAVLIYASRIFTNRSVLSSLPKLWIPVEKLDVPKSVCRLVAESLTRSAVIVQQTRPRDRTNEDNTFLDPHLTIPADAPPPWGKITHPGWTAPESEDLPNQEFEVVIKELPHLLEAKAVSLAPPNPNIPFEAGGDSIPDERVVDILQRPKSMCLRGYLNHLSRLGMIHEPYMATSFIRLFEKARYSERPLAEPEFRSMMGMFAELIRDMRGLDPGLITELRADYAFDSGSSMSMRSGPLSGDTASFTSDSASFSSQSGLLFQRNRYHSLGASASSDGSSSFRIQGIGDQQSARSSSGRRSDRTPSSRSLRPMASTLSGASGNSVVRRTVTQDSDADEYNANRVGTG